MAGRRWNTSWEQYGSSTPIRVEGGLATSRPRGPMADSWWSRRFVTTLESYGLGGRLERGRRYARQGQIVSLDIVPGLLSAPVQGSRPKPYLVSIAVASPTERQWRTIDAALLRQVGLTAHLLAGELPPELEDVFTAAKVPLFPARWSDLSAQCSCPDFANPCKHIAAVLYLFAERLDEDPWLLLEWRGRSQSDVLDALGLAPSSRPDAGLPPWWPLRPGEPLAPGTAALRGLSALDRPDPADAVLRRLGRLDVEAWKEPVEQALREVYAAVVAGLGGSDSAPGDD